MGVFFIYNVEIPNTTDVLVALTFDLHLFFLLFLYPKESIDQCLAYVLRIGAHPTRVDSTRDDTYGIVFGSEQGTLESSLGSCLTHFGIPHSYLLTQSTPLSLCRSVSLWLARDDE